jgi:vancomycin resistance protein VanJ
VSSRSPDDSPPKRSTTKTSASDARPASRWRRLLFWAIVVELAGVVLFVLVLLVGEQSRLTLISLYVPRHPLLAAALLGALLAPLTQRRVRLLVSLQIVVCLVVLFPVMGMTLSTSHQVERPIHLASYNVFFGKAGRSALVEEIAAMQADVIVVQAAFGSLGEKLVERLPGRTIRQDGEFVIVSNFPVRTVDVPGSLGSDMPSMYVKYVIETPQGTLRLFNVHPYSPRHALLGDHATGDDIALREAQIAAAVVAARSDVPPFVIAGDTNLPALSAIGRRHLSGLKDAFAEVGFGFGYTFPTKRPWMRIDRVLGSDDVRFGDIRVGPRGASDHRPVFVDFELAEH